MSVTVKQLEAEIEKYGELTALLAGCRSTIHELATIGKRHYERAEQLQASIIHAKWVSAMETIEQLQARVEELEGLIDNIYNSDCNLATASIIAANLIPPQQEKDDG